GAPQKGGVGMGIAISSPALSITGENFVASHQMQLRRCIRTGSRHPQRRSNTTRRRDARLNQNKEWKTKSVRDSSFVVIELGRQIIVACVPSAVAITRLQQKHTRHSDA